MAELALAEITAGAAAARLQEIGASFDDGKDDPDAALGDLSVSNVQWLLRGLGVSLSLDDFGSGYSSLGYLNRLPLNQLKIDRSFVTDADTDPRKRKVLRGVIELGKGLGMLVVAEGVERQEEADLLRELGCDAIQGFLYSRPTSALAVQAEIARLPTARLRRQRSKTAIGVLGRAG